MMSMNISPPRPMPANRVEMLPALKARIRKRSRRNMGSATLDSTTQKAASRATPPRRHESTNGLVHPMVCPP
jgi:hypothetical protein